MSLPFAKLAKETAEAYRQTILEYNATVAAEEATAGPTKRDLIKEAQRLADEGGKTDVHKSAKSAADVYTKALQDLNAARTQLAVVGAESLGVEFDPTQAEVSDEAANEARQARKELVSVLKMLADTGDAEFANSFEIPNVGNDKTQTLASGGTSRLRVFVDVAGPDDFSERFESLSALKLASAKKDSPIPEVDVDRLRKAYEDATEEQRKEGISGSVKGGWTVTLTPKS